MLSGFLIKFYVENVYTMAELKMTGNYLKFSWLLLYFVLVFDEMVYRWLIKEVLI